MSFVGGAGAVLLGGVGIADRLSVVAAQTEPQTLHGIIVKTEGSAVLVGDVELEGRFGTFVNPARVGELIGVQAGQELCLIAEFAITSEERETCLMPRGGHDDVLALGTIYREEVEGLVVGIVQAYGHHDMACADVGGLGEGLLNPELLEFHLAAFFHFLFPFAAFLVFLLVCEAVAAVLELYLSAERPAFAEVVAEVNHSVGDVETAVARVVLMIFGLGVAAHVVAVEIAAVVNLSVAADAQTVALGVLHHAVSSDFLGLCREGKSTGQGKHYQFV